MALKPRLPLWRQELTLTGRSRYEVDARGLITSHVDTWDAVADNSYLSVGPFCSHESQVPLISDEFSILGKGGKIFHFRGLVLAVEDLTCNQMYTHV